MNTISVNEITVNGKTYIEKGSAPEVQYEQVKGSPYVIGKNYYIRTVTFHYTGTLIGLTDQEIILAKAAWIADSGRWMQALEKGDLSEVEPYPEDKVVIINRQALCDASEWKHALPRTQK